MKIYTLMSGEEDSEGNISNIYWHKQFYFLFEDALQKAKCLGNHCCIIEFEEGKTWLPQQVKSKLEEKSENLIKPLL